MWWCLAHGLVDMVNSDHCSYLYSDKEMGKDDIWLAPFGIPGIETTNSILLDGVAQGRLTLQQVVFLRSERQAMIYGLTGQKGPLRVGCNADMIFVDMKRKVRLDNKQIFSKCGWTPYHGREVTGDVVLTMVRGKVVMQEGEVIDIHTYYGESYILQGISLEVAKGSVVAILGRNGVGKTTLVRSIIGFSPVRRGQILFKEIDITHMPSYKIIRMQMGLVPQGRRIFPSLTVKENLAVASRGSEVRQWDFEKIFTLFSHLKVREHHRGNELSGGEQQMLAFARALISNPIFLLMDEPTERLAPVLVREVEDVILRLKKEGLSILLVEQNISFAMKFSDYTHVMSKGKIVYSSTPKELWENEEVKEQYLVV